MRPLTCNPHDQTCNHHGQTVDICDAVESGNTNGNFWTARDSITIMENGQDLCGINQAGDIENCEITVTIIDV